MKTIKLTIIILLTISALSFINSGKGFNLVKALPFADGKPVNIYHFGALAILLISLWGYNRLKRQDESGDEEVDNTDNEEPTYYENEEDNSVNNEE